jgi:FAD/FMN-containing dehydrogenase
VVERTYTARLKEAFDPGGILNPELSMMPEAAGAD